MTKGLLGRLNNKTAYSFNGDITCGPMKAYLRYNRRGYFARIPCGIRQEFLSGPFPTIEQAYENYVGNRPRPKRKYYEEDQETKET